MDPSRPRNHATEETNQERLRRQFEHGEIPRYDFSAGEIPEYPQFVESRLSSKVRKKLAHRRTLGYVNPRALTPSERDSWDLLRNVRNGIESSNTLLGSLNPTAHQTKRAAEDAVRIPTERYVSSQVRQ